MTPGNTKARTGEPLAPDEIHLWEIALDAPHAPSEPLRGLLSETELERASGFHFLTHKHRWATARAALRQILATYVNARVRQIVAEWAVLPYGMAGGCDNLPHFNKIITVIRYVVFFPGITADQAGLLCAIGSNTWVDRLNWNTLSDTHQDLIADLFARYRDDLIRFLHRRVRCRHTAADLAQDAFLRLLRSERLPEIANLRAYLFTTANNLLIDHGRAQRWQTDALAGVEVRALSPEDTPTPETIVLGREALRRFAVAFSELPHQCRQILYLSRFEGLNHPQIAQRLGISVRTVEDNLKRAIKHCTHNLP